MSKSSTTPLSAVGIFDVGEWGRLLCKGYTPLVNVPEIQTPVNRIAELISSMTLCLMENTEVGDVRVDNELAYFLDVTPNKYMNRKELYYSVVRNMLLDGNGNAVVYPHLKPNDETGMYLLDDMEPLDMTMVSFVNDPSGYGYKVFHKGKFYQNDDILHFRANPDSARPWLGQGYRVILRDIAGNLTQAQKTKKSFMESPTPSVIVRMDGLTGDMASKEGRSKLADEYVEQENGKPWIIPAQLTQVEQIKPMTLSDIALNDNVTMDKRAAAAVFGVPPFLVGSGDFNKAEYNAFINSVILPLAKSIEQELTRKLLVKQEWFLKFNSRSLYSYDLRELIYAGSMMSKGIAISRNEWRDWIGLSPREDMAELLALENFIPQDRLGDQKKLGGDTTDE